MSLQQILKQQLSIEPLSNTPDIVVAFSGGVDSHVLLHALSVVQREPEFAFRLSAIHIHHGLSQHADAWQTHCEAVCRRLSVPFQTANVQVIAKPRHSLEAQAREARYQKLTELAPSGSQIVLAQHQDDQVETFLLQLKRGAGPKGLSGMNRQWTSRCSATQKVVNYCRPLLGISQSDIIQYAKEHKLDWCEDESNQNTDFDRNFLRHKVMPSLHSRWPSFAKSVSRSAQLCAQQQALLDEISAEKFNTIKANNNSLSLVELSQLSEPWLYQVVRFWLSELGLPSPSMAILKQLRSDVINAKQDATPALQWQGWEFRRFDQKLYVIEAETAKPSFEKQWLGEQHIQLPYQLGLIEILPAASSKEELTKSVLVDPSLGNILIRTGGYSAKFKPAGDYPTKPIKQWFKHWKIAPWLRSSVVMIIQNDEVVAALIDGYWQRSESTSAATKAGIISINFQA